MVNQLVEDLIDYNFQTRHNATREASVWLGNQLNDLRKQSEDLQAKVVDLQRDSGVFSFGQTDTQGHEQVFTPALDRLQQATTQLEQAQSARIMKGALYQVVKDGDPELISGLAGNGMLSGASAGVTGSLTLLQNLRSEEAQTQAKLNELSAKFGPGYPKLAELQSSLDSTQKSIRAEAARVAARVQNDYTVAQQIEDKDRAVFLEEKSQAEGQNDKAVQYQIARQEATQSRNLYENLVSPYEGSRRGCRHAFQQHHAGGSGSRARQTGKAKRPHLCAGFALPEDFFSEYAGRSSAMLRTTASRSSAKWRCSLPKLPSACSPTMMQDRAEARSARRVVGIRGHCPFRRIHADGL